MVTLVDPKTNNVDATRIVDGVIVKNPTKPDFGSIMFQEDYFSFGTGFVNAQKRVHFESGKIEDLQRLVAARSLKANGQYPMRIVVKESTIPSFEGQQPKINPSTAAVVTHNGLSVYRTTKMVEANNTEEHDVTLSTDKVAATPQSTAKTDMLNKTETIAK